MKITRKQFQAAIEAGIDATELHGTDYADRLREIGRTDTVSRTHSFGSADSVTCPAIKARLSYRPRHAFARTFDWKLFEDTQTYYIGKVQIVDA